LTWKYHQARILSFNTKEVAKINTSNIKPIHIKAYPVGVDIDIKPAIITKGVWPVFPNSAGYVFNENNIIIYGHNRDNILGPIRYINNGAIIEVLKDDGVTYKYEVVKTDTINPDNLVYIQPSMEEILTVYTCIDIFDSKRFIVVAELIGY
jgi:LPXTG-site transpeptidase (sortase) family protein